MSSREPFVADKIIGLLLVILPSCLCVIVPAIVFGWMSYMGTVAGELPAKGMPAGFAALPIAVILFVVLVSVIIHIVAGVGIIKSAAWGFWVAIGISILGVGSGGLTPVSLGIIVYAILRLTGTVGPKPV